MDDLIISTANGRLTAEPVCEIDHCRAVRIREQIDRALYTERPETLELRLGKVDFMDSSGIGLILGRYEKAKAIGCRTVISSPTKRVSRLLTMSGIDKIIKIEVGEGEKNS
ncbi:MAG: anti-sigma factor antagonist [Clostridia bacterium]|nr:anti-sigma factor antagonist [Clostridia bacterium]